MKSILPIIIVLLLLTGAITYSLSKRAIPKTVDNQIGIPANELTAGNQDTKSDTVVKTGLIYATPTPTVTVSPTPTPTKAVVAEAKVASIPSTTEKGGEIAVTPTPAIKKVVSKTTKTSVCTPVYGQADTCTEHIVVDTGAENAIFFNLAGLAYLAGLASFIKAKAIKA